MAKDPLVSTDGADGSGGAVGEAGEIVPDGLGVGADGIGRMFCTACFLISAASRSVAGHPRLSYRRPMPRDVASRAAAATPATSAEAASARRAVALSSSVSRVANPAPPAASVKPAAAAVVPVWAAWFAIHTRWAVSNASSPVVYTAVYPGVYLHPERHAAVAAMMMLEWMSPRVLRSVPSAMMLSSSRLGRPEGRSIRRQPELFAVRPRFRRQLGRPPRGQVDRRQLLLPVEASREPVRRWRLGGRHCRNE